MTKYERQTLRLAKTCGLSLTTEQTSRLVKWLARNYRVKAKLAKEVEELRAKVDQLSEELYGDTPGPRYPVTYVGRGI